MPELIVDGTALYYEIHGSGSPLLLLNGIGLDGSAWGSFATALSREFRVLVLDARGAGRSGSPPPPYTTALLAADAAALLEQLAIGPAHVLGLSLGGLVAQELALSAPRHVRSLVLAATAARLPGRPRRALDAWRRLLLAGTDGEAFLREQLAWVLGSTSLEEDAVVEGWAGALAAAALPTARGFAGQAAACIEHDTRERLAGVRVPTLVLAGEDDALVPSHASRALASLLPRARFEAHPGGHAFLVECGERVLSSVVEFLREVEKDGHR